MAQSDGHSDLGSVRSAQLLSKAGNPLNSLDHLDKLKQMGYPCKLVIREEANADEVDDEPEPRDCCPLNQDVRERLIRCFQITLIPVIWLFILNAVTHGGEGSSTHWLSRFVGINIFILFTLYFGNLAVELCPREKCCKRNKRAYLFKVETRMTRVPEWAEMRVANTQLVHLFRPIQSISEFSAISGGLANHMIANLGPISLVMVIMLFGSEMQCMNGNGFSWDVADGLLLVGVSGIVVIGIFELNHFELAMKRLHYLGVMMAICILVASLIQGVALGGGYKVFPIVMNAIAWPCFVYWQFLSSNKRAQQFEDRLRKRMEQQNAEDDPLKDEGLAVFAEKLRHEINWFTLKCIALEGTVIYCVTLALAYYVFFWGTECGRGCASIWYHNHYDH